MGPARASLLSEKQAQPTQLPTQPSLARTLYLDTGQHDGMTAQLDDINTGGPSVSWSDQQARAEGAEVEPPPRMATTKPKPVLVPVPAPVTLGGPASPPPSSSTTSTSNSNSTSTSTSTPLPRPDMDITLDDNNHDNNQTRSSLHSSHFSPTPPPSSLDRRIASLESRLLEEGIGSALPPQPRTLPPGVVSSSPSSSHQHQHQHQHQQQQSSTPSKSKGSNGSSSDQLLKTFLSTLRSMAGNVSKTPVHPDPKIRTTKERALLSLISILELSLDETARLSSELDAAQAKEGEYRSVMAGLVGRVHKLDEEVGTKSRAIGMAERRAEELSRELDGAQAKVREMADSNDKRSREDVRDASTCTDGCGGGRGGYAGSTTADDGAATAGDKNDNSMDERVLEQIRKESERLRDIVGQIDGTGATHDDQEVDSGAVTSVDNTAPPRYRQQQQQQPSSSAHDAIHVELRAQAALLEEENRRLLQRLDIGGGGPSSNGQDIIGNPSFSSHLPNLSPFFGMSGSNDGMLQQQQQQQLVNPSHDGAILVQQLQSQNEKLHRELQDRDERLARGEANLRALVENGRTSSAEVSRLAAEGGAARRRLEEEVRRAEAAERTVMEAERERSDMLRAYRAVVDERGRLATRVEELARERSRLCQELTLRQEEVRSLEGRFGEMEREFSRRAEEGADYERKLGDASRDCLALRRSLGTAEASNTQLKREIESSRQSTGIASNQAVELQRAVARAQQEVEELRRSISVLEDEKARLETALLEEKRRVEGMECVVSTTRAKEAAAAEQISKLSRENARLATKLNEADARLEAASTSRKSSRFQRNGGAGGRGVGGRVLAETSANHHADPAGIPATISFSKDEEAKSGPKLSDYLNTGGA